METQISRQLSLYLNADGTAAVKPALPPLLPCLVWPAHVISLTATEMTTEELGVLFEEQISEGRDLGDRKAVKSDTVCFTATTVETMLKITVIKIITLDEDQIKTTVWVHVVQKCNNTEYKITPLARSIPLWTWCQHNFNTVPSDERHGKGKTLFWSRESEYLWYQFCVNAQCFSAST